MAEQQTIMERLFHTLDEKAKTLNNENGQSFIENLGLWNKYIPMKRIVRTIDVTRST